jgi:hypothetical protein
MCYYRRMATKLEDFLKSRKIKPVQVARRSGYSRQHLLRVRKGCMEPTRRCIKAITAACYYLADEPVKAADLFDLDVDASYVDALKRSALDADLAGAAEMTLTPRRK